MPDSFTFAVLGAGGRGSMFAQWILDHADAGRVVAVAEPNAESRNRQAKAHGIPPERCFSNWEDLLAQPRLADVVFNTLMDRLHAPAAVKALDLGYHMLLEKPMAVTLEDCLAIDAAQRRNHRVVSVCHSLRYHVVYTEIKKLLDAGAIGRLISIDQLEGVEPIHQSHSFVRGNWGNESRSTFMLLSKSCHDVDIIAYLVGRPCLRVSSFGALTHFRPDQAPPGATLRCTDGCPAEPDCIYSALKIYLPDIFWGTHAGFGGKTNAQRLEMLRTGPFGRCVYQTDNDVVDHQVVAMEFDGEVTATFTMTAFDPGGRHIRLHGTAGAIRGTIESNTVELVRFSDRATQITKIPSQVGGHGGADDNVMRNFIHALRAGNPDAVLTTTAESLASHAIAFAAEQARHERRVVELAELKPVHRGREPMLV
jgi:predicted dehydrogenase